MINEPYSKSPEETPIIQKFIVKRRISFWYASIFAFVHFNILILLKMTKSNLADSEGFNFFIQFFFPFYLGFLIAGEYNQNKAKESVIAGVIYALFLSILTSIGLYQFYTLWPFGNYDRSFGGFIYFLIFPLAFLFLISYISSVLGALAYTSLTKKKSNQ